MLKEFTATAYVIKDQKALLIFHRKLQKWLPPGGHIDSNEVPSEAAKREVLEETGFEIELIEQENVWVEERNATSFPRPYMCLLEEIPAYGDHPAHQHMDMVYLARPVGGSLLHNERETEAIRWFRLDEVNALEPEVEIFTETRDVLRHILANSPELVEV